jgi:hypothetical protein
MFRVMGSPDNSKVATSEPICEDPAQIQCSIESVRTYP